MAIIYICCLCQKKINPGVEPMVADPDQGIPPCHRTCWDQLEPMPTEEKK